MIWHLTSLSRQIIKQLYRQENGTLPHSNSYTVTESFAFCDTCFASLRTLVVGYYCSGDFVQIRLRYITNPTESIDQRERERDPIYNWSDCYFDKMRA